MAPICTATALPRKEQPVSRPGTFTLTALLAAMTAIGPLSTDMYLPSLPAIAHAFDSSTAQAQFTISSYLVGFAIGQLIYGPVSDRYGRKPVLLAAVAVYCAASFGCMVSTSIDMLIVFRTLQALGGCGGVVLARAVVRDLYSGARAGRELSLISMVMALAPVVAPLIGGVVQTGFGWRGNFVVLTASGLLIAAAVWWRLPETLATRAPASSPLAMVRAFGGFLRDGNFLANTGLVVLVFSGLFAWISASAFVLQDLYGLSSFAFGIAFAVGSGGFMAGSAIASRYVGRLGLDRVIGMGAAAQTIGGGLMIVALALGLRSAASLVVPMAIYLSGLGLVLPQAMAGAMQPYRDRAGAASSLLGFLQQTGAALCGVIVGQLLGDSAWPMAVAIALTGVASLILWMTTRGIRQRALVGH
jgi:DHA1 family bicyclomycin/chloramphenicol resistance-like MFS transporter